VQGKLDDCEGLLAQYYPNILVSHAELRALIYFQNFIEIIKSGDAARAIEYAQSHLQELDSKTFKTLSADGLEAEIPFETVMGLLCYENPGESALQHLLAPEQRHLVADIVNRSILSYMKYYHNSVLEVLLSQLIQIEERFKENDFYFGELFKFKV
jgi:hypothetical protein